MGTCTLLQLSVQHEQDDAEQGQDVDANVQRLLDLRTVQNTLSEAYGQQQHPQARAHSVHTHNCLAWYRCTPCAGTCSTEAGACKMA